MDAPLFFETFPGKQHEFSEICCISFSVPLRLTEEDKAQHWTTCCTVPKVENVEKTVNHKSEEMQENCDSRGKVTKLETSDRIRRVDECASSLLMFTL